MATTTTNYGWDIPQSTDLVKDGATAIATLGQDIDTSLYTALGGKKPMAVHLSTVTFSAVSSVSLPADSFTTTYDNYRVLFHLASVSTSMTITTRFRTSGTDNSTANYSFYLRDSNSSSGADTNTFGRTQTSATIKSTASNVNSFVFDVKNPKLTSVTTVTGQGNGQDSNLLTMGHSFTLTTSFDSMSFIASTGNFTGNVSVYGYNQ